MRRRIAGWLAIGLLWAAPAWGQAHAGVRAGVSGTPDQFIFGAHVETAPIAPDVTFRPNVEVGLGGGLTTLAANLELAYSMPLRRRPWRVYLGAGPALIVASGSGPRRNGGTSTVSGGFNVLIGAERTHGLLTELKVGFLDSPEVKVIIGYAFK